MSLATLRHASGLLAARGFTKMLEPMSAPRRGALIRGQGCGKSRAAQRSQGQAPACHMQCCPCSEKQ